MMPSGQLGIDAVDKHNRMQAICSRCGQPSGKHSFVGDNCPTDTWFSTTSTFELNLQVEEPNAG